MRNYWENKLKHQNNIERKQKTATVSSVDQSQLRQLNTAPETGSESWIFSCFPPTRQHSCALAQRHYSSRKQTLLTRTRASCCQVSRSTFTSNSNQLSRLKRSTKAPWQKGEKVRGVGVCGGGGVWWGRKICFIHSFHSFLRFLVWWQHVKVFGLVSLLVCGDRLFRSAWGFSATRIIFTSDLSGFKRGVNSGHHPLDLLLILQYVESHSTDFVLLILDLLLQLG